MNEWKNITDPEELFKLKREGWEIEFANSSSQVFAKWFGLAWNAGWKFHARPRQPKMKKVKLLCFYNGKNLFWAESGEGYAYRCRVPSEDKEVEIPE